MTTGKQLVQHRIHSRLANTEVSYHLLTPPDYYQQDYRYYPVIYWLHGSAGGFEGLRVLARYFDDAMRQGMLPDVIVVFPYGKAKSLWIDARDGQSPVESVFIKEIVPDVDRRYRTIDERSGRLLEGFSMGGYGAARIGFKHSNLFGALSLLAAGPLQPRLSAAEGPAIKAQDRVRALRSIFNDDPDSFEAVSPWALASRYAAQRQRDAPLMIRQVIGDLDQSLPANQAFSDHLNQLGIAHRFYRVPGVGHRPLKLLDGLGEANWQFYRHVLADQSQSRRGFAPERTAVVSPAAPSEAGAEVPAQTRSARATSPTAGPALDRDWILQQSVDHFTIQLAAARSVAAARRHVEGLGGLDIRFVPTRSKSQDFVVVLAGVYPARADAERALGQLPAALREQGYWIRSVGSVRRAVR